MGNGSGQAEFDHTDKQAQSQDIKSQVGPLNLQGPVCTSPRRAEKNGAGSSVPIRMGSQRKRVTQTGSRTYQCPKHEAECQVMT